MTQTTRTRTDPRAQAVRSIDTSLMRMRRLLTKPPGEAMALPVVGRPVSHANALACEAVAALSADGGSASVKDVAAFLTLDQSTTSRLLSEVEDAGFVVRSIDPDDRRRSVVRLTAEGEVLVEVVVGIRDGFVGALVAHWSDADMEIFARLLADLSARATTELEKLACGEMPADLERAVHAVERSHRSRTSPS